MLSTVKGGREIAIRPLILALDSLFEMHVLYCANFEANEVNPDLLKKVACILAKTLLSRAVNADQYILLM